MKFEPLLLVQAVNSPQLHKQIIDSGESVSNPPKLGTAVLMLRRIVVFPPHLVTIS